MAARSVAVEGSRASRKTGLTCDIVWRSAAFMKAGSRMNVVPSARKGVRLGNVGDVGEARDVLVCRACAEASKGQV